MSSSQSIDIQKLSLDLETYRAGATNAHVVASFTLLLYDHFLTIGSEIDLIWPTPWSAGKVLFYATKYPALLDSAFLLYTCFAPPGLIVTGITVAEYGPSPIANADFVCWGVTPPGNTIFLDYILLVIFETNAINILCHRPDEYIVTLLPVSCLGHQAQASAQPRTYTAHLSFNIYSTNFSESPKSDA
ncbi:hypothetical protein BU17DRAFT_60268 [Hysterangium stoloniferum]|nr:hypothetical protein BU17DRAFT_60268 [Hysterangium stoloniferum]